MLSMPFLFPLEFSQDWLDIVKCFIDIFLFLSSCQDNFSRHKDEHYNFGLNHSVDHSRKKFRLISAKLAMNGSKNLQSNREFHITGCNHVLNFEIFKFGTIPIYLWNDLDWLPFKDEIDYKKLCINIHYSQLNNLENFQYVLWQFYILRF